MSNSKFEQRGVMFQYEADSKSKAIKSFKRSCTSCCYGGRNISCEDCAIKVAHEDMIAIFNDIEMYNRNKSEKYNRNKSVKY